MPKFKEVLHTIFEAKKYEKGLKLIYNVDIYVKEPKEQPAPEAPAEVPEVPEVPAAPAEVPPEVPAVPETTPVESFKEKVKGYLVEDVVDTKKKGIMAISKEEAMDIQTIDDLLDFLKDKQDDTGRPVLNEFAVELVATLSSPGVADLKELVKKEDKVLVELDYGANLNDSVGFKVLKRGGVENISIMLKKDGSILPSKFSVQEFNEQIIAYRNSLLSNSGE